MKQSLAFTGTATAFCVLAAYFGFRFGQMSVDLDATCPAYATKARLAQIAALDIAEGALALSERSRQSLGECEARWKASVCSTVETGMARRGMARIVPAREQRRD